MKIATTLITVVGLCALSACGDGADRNDAANLDANMMATDNLAVDANMDMNMDANMSVNAADGMNATENAVVNDLTTNDADANLANGM